MSSDITFERVAPVFPVRNVAAALEHYARLGFQSRAYGEKDGGELVYGFVSWGPVELHLSRTRGLDPKLSASAC